ncbi:MAG: AMP-binding protein [Opitutaceae bacterium]|nr:AMP-binding protein [Opitutaceae bacterium]
MERADLKALVLSTGCAEARGDWVLLMDPAWPTAERIRARRLLATLAASKPRVRQGWLGLPTGGTSGVVKFARHDEKTLGAAVRGFSAHFGLKRVNAVGVLPAHHVSGLMARVRCAATGGTYLDWDWKALEAGRRPALRGGPWAISLVPTQLQRLLRSRTAVRWLRRFAIVFLGGGPVWPELAEDGARAGLKISLSYGMTETAAMIAALRPREFLAGDRSSGRPLPHARVRIGRDGGVRVGGKSLFRGYAGGAARRGDFVTGDLGTMDAKGRLRIIGRRDAVIITGGKKVHPAQVEAALRATGKFADVAVIGLPDREWGEIVVACQPAGPRAPVRVPALPDLPAYQRPKRLIPISPWPRNAQGKVDRARLRAAAMRAV